MKPKNEVLAPTLGELLVLTGRRLSPLGDTPELDAQLLIAHAAGQPRTWVLAHPDSTFDPNRIAVWEELLHRLEEGEPLPYVLGHWEFFGLDFDISSEVLIPRPETELIVERAIAWLKAAPERRSIADVGTGSGCIAVALARHVPDGHILATDLSEAALNVARRNASKFEVEHQIEFVQCNLLPDRPKPVPMDQRLDLICANLPYIPTETLHQLPVYQREPTLALDGGPDGLDPFRNLIHLSVEWLAPQGKLLLEIEAAHGMAAAAIAYDAFSNAEIHLHQDLSGRDRLLEIQVREE